MTLIGKAIRSYNTGNDLYGMDGAYARETLLIPYLRILFRDDKVSVWNSGYGLRRTKAAMATERDPLYEKHHGNQ